MKGTAQFKEIIKNYLDNRAKEDELFRAKYETTTRTIDDVVTFILNEVQQSGCCGFSDEEHQASVDEGKRTEYPIWHKLRKAAGCLPYSQARRHLPLCRYSVFLYQKSRTQDDCRIK